MSYLAGAFLMLHGLVHLLYAGHSRGIFELRPGLAWPGGSWALARTFGEATTRRIATVACFLAAAAFVAAGLAMLAEQEWWRAAVVGAAAYSSLVFVLLWDGKAQGLSDQGGIAVLINAAIVVAALVVD